MAAWDVPARCEPAACTTRPDPTTGRACWSIGSGPAAWPTTRPLDEWCRDVAPSNELRKWYQHDPGRFAEFTQRYTAEVHDPERAEAFAGLVARSRQGSLILLTATKQVDISHAAVLAQLIAG